MPWRSGMVTRQQWRRLKAAFWASMFAAGVVLLVRSFWLRQELSKDHMASYSSAPSDMLSQAKREALKRKASEHQVPEPAGSYNDDMDLPDLAVERLIESAEKRRKAAAEEAPLVLVPPPAAPTQPLEAELKNALDGISKLLEANGEKIGELQLAIERVGKRVKAQEDISVEMESILKSRLMFIAEKQENILKQTTQITKQNEVPFFRVTKYADPPVSTITCFGNSTIDRVCKVKNLCYDPEADNFFIFKDTNSLEINTPKNRSYLVDSTSIDQHNRFFFDYHEVHPDRFEHRTFRVVEKLSFLISRFHVYNIMHTVHDDFLGLYLLHRMFAPNTDADPSFSFTQDNNLFFVDSFTNLRYDYIFQLLTKNPLQFRGFYKKDRSSRMPVCFRDAIVGNSKLASWYSYGWMEPQGPIPNKTVSGLMVREAASYLLKRFHLPPWNENAIRGIVGDLKVIIEDRRLIGRRDVLQRNLSDHHYITVFSRKIDRLIVNEQELSKELQQYYGLEVRYVRIEDMHLLEQISILKNTVVAVGMHGSALILSMFLPPGAMLLELFPYRVPPENYTPYRTLCGLPGIRLAYRAWANTHPENNHAHPDKPAGGGGIRHLPEAEQQRILDNTSVPPHLCCTNPNWLFRIYQDTKVDIDEVLGLIDDGIMDGARLVNADPGDYVYIRPASIENVYCKVAAREDDPEQLDLTVSWTKPWNGVKPDFYGIWVHQTWQEYSTNGTVSEYTLRNCNATVEYDLWVRPYTVDPINGDVFKGAYSDKFTCACAIDTKAVRGKPE